MRAPIPYSEDLERLADNEEKTFDALQKEFQKIVSTTHRVEGTAARGVHAKSHALLKGRLRVHAGLPSELAQGLFAQPGVYPLVARLSSIPGDRLRDAVSGPRGFALKMSDVPGELLPDAEGNAVQDLIFANGPAFNAPDSQTFLRSLKLLALTTDRAEGAKAWLSRVLRFIQSALSRVGRSIPALDLFGGYLPRHPLGDRYFTQAPLRYGRYVAKFDLIPETENFQALSETRIDIDREDCAIRSAVRDAFAQGGGRFTLRVQLCRDLEQQPIEDASRVWPEDISPFQPVASIEFPRQVSWDDERSRVWEQELSFSPWHGLVDHRPLGNVMRARRAAYPYAAQLRARLNGCPMRLLPPTTTRKKAASDRDPETASVKKRVQRKKTSV